MAIRARRRRRPTCSVHSGGWISPTTENGGVDRPVADTSAHPIFVNAWVTRPARACRWRAPRSTSGTVRRGHTTKTRIPRKPTWNLRGKVHDRRRRATSRFRSIKPIGYPIPINGPVGDLLRAQGRHNPAPCAHPFPDLQAGLQDPVLAGLFERRSESRNRRPVRRDRAR